MRCEGGEGDAVQEFDRARFVWAGGRGERRRKEREGRKSVRGRKRG